MAHQPAISEQTPRNRTFDLGVFVQNELPEFITQVDSESDYIMWFKVNMLAFKTDEYLHIGVVYVPPSNSRFNTIDETNIFNV